MWMRLVGRFAVWAGLLLITAAIGRGDDPQDAGRASAPPSGAQAAGTAGQEVARPPLTSEGGSTLYRGAEAYQRASGARPRPKRTIKAHVVALDQPYMWNRLGASQPNAMVYALARDVVPDLVRHALPGEAVRVWDAGCATGEESYSLVMLLRDAADQGRLDEADLTFSPMLVGTSSTPDTHALTDPRSFALTQVIAAEDFLMARYTRRDDA